MFLEEEEEEEDTAAAVFEEEAEAEEAEEDDEDAIEPFLPPPLPLPPLCGSSPRQPGKPETFSR